MRHTRKDRSRIVAGAARTKTWVTFVPLHYSRSQIQIPGNAEQLLLCTDLTARHALPLEEETCQQK